MAAAIVVREEGIVKGSHQLPLMSPNDKPVRSLVAYRSFAHFRVRMEAIKKSVIDPCEVSSTVSYL